jgi:hypothetical protein
MARRAKSISPKSAFDQFGKDVERATMDASNFVRIEAPSFYASQVVVQVANNDAMITFIKAHPMTTPEGASAPIVRAELVDIVQVSIGDDQGRQHRA